MDDMCRRLETLAKDLSRVTETLSSVSSTRLGDSLSKDLVEAANVLQSFPELVVPFATPSQLPESHRRTSDTTSDTHDSHVELKVLDPIDSSTTSTDDESDDEFTFQGVPESNDGQGEEAGALVSDSYGRLR
jgi:hypothetical protein